MPYADPKRKQAYDAERYAAARDEAKRRVADYRAAHLTGVRATQALYRLTHHAAIRAKDAKDYQKHRTARDEATRAWVKAHPDQRAEHVREWKKANPESGRDYKKRRKARLRGAETIEHFGAREIYERDGWICGICGGPIAPGTESLDHIRPVSRGGPHTRANVRAAHRICNRNRGNRS